MKHFLSRTGARYSCLKALSFCLFPAAALAQTEQLYTPNQVAPASDPCNTINVPVYGFAFNSTTFSNPVFSGLAGFVTSGTYVAGDIANFKLYQTNFSVFNTSNLLATITTGLGPGSHTFPAFSYTVSPSPVARYFWITVDIQPGAVNGHTLDVSPLTTAMTTITGTETAATITAGGTQTITCSSPLPVELLTFTGKAAGDANRIAWTTASEVDNDFFTVERSGDGIVFSEMVRVSGAGSSPEPANYVVADAAPAGLTYYRLKQTDLNGTPAFYGTISVHNDREAVPPYPNPAGDKVLVRTEAGEYVLFDPAGTIVDSGPLQKGENLLDVSLLAEGIYFFKANETAVQKIVVRR